MGSEAMACGGDDSPEHHGLNSWIHNVKTSGGVTYYEDYRLCSGHGWAAPPGSIFQVRGEAYHRSHNKLKVSASKDWVLEPVAFDWAKTGSGSGKIFDVMGRGNSRVRAEVAAEIRRRQARGHRPKGESESDPLPKGDPDPDDESKTRSAPFLWVINLQVPSKENHSLVMYYAAREGVDGSSDPATRLAARFVDGDSAFRNARLKLIAHIVDGPWIVKKAVGDRAVTLLGKAVNCSYVQGENYMEMDIDIGSSRIAHTIVQLAFGYVTHLTVDLGFVLEGQSAEELPERLLAAVRFANLDPNAACFIDPQAPFTLPPLSPPTPTPLDTTKPLGRPKSLHRLKSYSRLWRSMSALFHSPTAAQSQCEEHPHANGLIQAHTDNTTESNHHHKS